MNYSSYVYYVFFSNFPWKLYSLSNQTGNMGYTGLALGMIRNQQIFWIANGFATCFYWTKYNPVFGWIAVTLYSMNALKSMNHIPLIRYISHPLQN